MLLDNLLTMKMASEAFGSAKLITPEGIKPLHVGFESEDSYNAARKTDVYQMLETLIGNEESNISGYELPPEFDFINYNVDPFQMIVIPINHVLKKQELIDIYQGIMPDSSLKFTKESAFAEVRPLAGTSEDGIYSWMPRTNIDLVIAQGGPGSISPLMPQNFFSPKFFMQIGAVYRQYCDTTKAGGPNGLWIKTPEDFYKNLKFMTFKIKQKAYKDYDKYRNRQIQKVLDQSALADVPPDEQHKINVKKLEGSLLKKTVGEVFGSNWPYDDFSLIEMVKIDIDLEVL